MSRPAPNMLPHSSGQAFVRIKKKNYYLGKYGTPEAAAKYEEIMAVYWANNRSIPDSTSPKEQTVEAVMLGYLTWAEKEYVKNGKATDQVPRVKLAIKPAVELFGTLPAARFGVTQMEEVLQRMVGYGWTRGYCNTCFSVLKGAWKWAGLREFITMEQYHRLKEVPGLKKRRTAAPESQKVRSVKRSLVQATLPFMAPIPRDMAQIQLLTGMRPNEVCVMRACDIDRRSTPWVYRPHIHKLEHKELDRVIYLGPKARAILEPYLRRREEEGRPGAYLFSPQESIADYIERTGHNIGRPPSRQLKEVYAERSYYAAIRYACLKGDLPHWTPLQIRHRRATDVWNQHSPDEARRLLGHTHLDTTEIYVDEDEHTDEGVERQKKIAEEEG
jgi:integrase